MAHDKLFALPLNIKDFQDMEILQTVIQKWQKQSSIVAVQGKK